MNEKNYDPQMHTAEHILNGTMVEFFGVERSFSNHIERKKSKCDYHFENDLSDADIEKISAKVNAIIAADLPVIEEILPIEEAKARFDLSRLPDDAGETIRIIKVGDYDACPCSGPHVENTAAIGEFNITTKTFEDGVLRLRFKLNRPA